MQARSRVGSPGTLGAYGLRLAGVDGASSLLLPAEPAWPLYELASRVGTPEPGRNVVGRDVADFVTRSGVGIRIERRPGRAIFTLPRPAKPHELVHPLLAHVAAIVSWWMGRESLHAGAFAAGGRVWAVVGERGTGKSSTLAWLARAGHEIVADDMLVLDGMRVLAGPRTLDLRADASERLGAGEPLGRIGDRDRWRLELSAVRDLPAFGGLFFLGWGSKLEARRIPPAERLAALAANRGVNLPPPDPALLLRLAALPAFDVVRPRRWEALAETADELRRLAAA